VFVVVLLLVGTGEQALIRAGALYRPAVLEGQWWRILTALFLHAGPLHLLVNMYALHLLGRLAETMFGSVRFLIVYLAGGIVGGISSTLLSSGTLSVGASGAIMALLGGAIAALLRGTGNWPPTWRRSLLMNLSLLAVLQVIIGIAVPAIDNAAHLGGLVGGALVALVLVRAKP
jgi:rhomboid protease GluP